jgi:hypothetical protein
MIIQFIRVLALIALLAGGAAIDNSFELDVYHSEMGWHYGCDPHHADDRLFKDYRNGKELF